MAIKVICDICKNEPADDKFAFEATKSEIVDTFEVGNRELEQKKRLDKKVFQICKSCYYEHLDKLLK